MELIDKLGILLEKHNANEMNNIQAYEFHSDLYSNSVSLLNSFIKDKAVIATMSNEEITMAGFEFVALLKRISSEVT